MADMQNNAIGVETNSLAKKMKMATERKGVKDEPSSSTNTKFDDILKTMEKLVPKLTPRAEPQPQIRNPNFRRPPGPQVHQRDQKNPVKISR